MSVGFVSGNYFDSLGARVAPAALVDADARAPGSELVVVLTHESWSRLFDRDPMVIGRRLDVNGVPLVVVGVMAPEFSGMDEVPARVGADHDVSAAARRTCSPPMRAASR